MPTLHFKTSINCASCVRAVTPFLNAEPTVQTWRVDTTTPAKVLTVEGEQVAADQIMKAVAEAGFDIEPLAA